MNVDDARQFCTFRVERLRLGIDVRHVQEVLRYQPMSRVPLAPAVVRGLINLRGQIVMAIDLRDRLELPPRAAERRPINIVVRTADGAVSLLADELCDVANVTEDMFELMPDTVSGVTAEVIVGCYKLPDDLLLVLDPERVADVVAQVEASVRTAARSET